MKLSEAIRLGAKKKPHQLGYLFLNGATCALGSALDGVGCLKESAWDTPEYVEMYETAESIFPLLTTEAVSPVGLWASNVRGIIEDLNDKQGWTRERIAAWVETIERSQASLGDAMEPATATAASEAQ